MTAPAEPAPASLFETGPAPVNRPLLAIILRICAMLALCITFALGKLLNEQGVHLAEIVFWRQLTAVPVVFAWAMVTVGPSGIATRHLGAHARRTGVGLIGMYLNFGAIVLLPLAEATTLGFTAPIFATLLSALILREATGWHRWSAILVGFAGILLMARPDAGHFPLFGVVVGLCAAVFVGIVSIVVRQLSRTESTTAIVFWYSLLSLPPTAIPLFWVSHVHDAMTYALLVALGVIGGVAQMLLTAALRWGKVSVVLTMDYSSILWATILGWLLWDRLPIASTWGGAALIIGAGLYIARREHRLGRDEKLRAAALSE